MPPQSQSQPLPTIPSVIFRSSFLFSPLMVTLKVRHHKVAKASIRTINLKMHDRKPFVIRRTRPEQKKTPHTKNCIKIILFNYAIGCTCRAVSGPVLCQAQKKNLQSAGYLGRQARFPPHLKQPTECGRNRNKKKNKSGQPFLHTNQPNA